MNFFVGENSTGKTSVLSLIELFANPKFWSDADFNVGSYEFGGYHDIVSAFSKDKSEFQIGLYHCDKNKPDNWVGQLLHFKDSQSGLATLSRFSAMTQNLIATLEFKGRSLRSYVGPNEATKISQYIDVFNYLSKIPSENFLYSSVKRDDRLVLINSPLRNFWYYIRHELVDKSRIKFNPFKFARLPSSYASIAPIRTRPKRTYDGYTKQFNSEGEHTPYVIRKNLERRGKEGKNFKEILSLFGKESGLFESISVTNFGKSHDAPFELRISLEGKSFRVNSVGYGISQILPIIVELFSVDSQSSWLAIQQPEVHLHPKAQAALGELFFYFTKDGEETLLVETHSDYTIDRFRMCMRENQHPERLAQILYFERSSEGNTITSMEISPSGDYPDDQPESFRAFFLTEQRKLLGI